MQGKCSECGWSGSFTGYGEREVDVGLVEVGIKCPNCEKWFHSHYLTPYLKRIMTNLKMNPTKELEQTYHRTFNRLQKAQREKRGVEAPRMVEENESTPANNS